VSDLIGDYAELRVYARDAVTLRGTIVGLGVGFTDPFGDEPGEAAFTVNPLESIFAADPGQFHDSIVKVALPLTADPEILSEVWGFFAYPGGGNVVTTSEDAGKTRNYVGRGLLWAWNDFGLRFEKYREKANEDRYFGWMSGWYLATPEKGWLTPLGVAWNADPTARATFPPELEEYDPTAAWIAATGPTVSQPPGSIHLIRNKPGTFVLTQKSNVRIHWTVDNFGTMYLNGEKISELEGDAYTWRSLEFVDLIGLEPGEYTIAVRISNAALTSGGNPMGFICNVATLDGFGQPDTFILHTDTTNWVAHKVQGPEPGLTVGEILIRLRQEAIDRGYAPMASRITLDFTATHDSDGAIWSDLENRNWRIGTLCSQVISDLGENSADFDMGHNLVMKAYGTQGTHKEGVVALQRGVHLLSYTYAAQPPTATDAWVQYQDGYLEVLNHNYPIEPREVFFEAGTSASQEQATQAAQAMLKDSARVRYSYTAVFHGISGVVPYLDFGKGDWIMAYDMNGSPLRLRVASISMGRPDGEGYLAWTVELEESEDPGGGAS
jgi:hypothetical protein